MYTKPSGLALPLHLWVLYVAVYDINFVYVVLA